MKKIVLPAHFDGNKFIKKFHLDYTDFFVDGGILNYDELKTKKILTDSDLIDCIVDEKRFQRIVKREQDALTNAKSIPSWATWSEQDALEWANSHISDTQIDAINNLDDAKTLLRFLSTAIQGMARMEIAIRDKLWPDLPEVEE